MSISKISWLYIGQSFFGFLIGYMVGLSISPIVSTVLGLMFAFIGGSLIVLIKGKSETELEVIGKSITALSSFMLIGIAMGIFFKANDVLNSTVWTKFNSDKPLYQLSEPLNLQDIIYLGKKDEYAGLICSILKNRENKTEININKTQLTNLIDENVNPNIIMAMFGYDINCTREPQTTIPKQFTEPVVDSPEPSKTVLKGGAPSPDRKGKDDIPSINTLTKTGNEN